MTPTQEQGGIDNWRPGEERHRGQLRLAERLMTSTTDRLRYVHGIGWYYWDTTRWCRDINGNATREAIATVKAAYNDLGNLGRDAQKDLLVDIHRAESATGIEGVLRLARSMLPLAVSVDELDADSLLLNTPSGTLDLRTGELRPHDPADLCTKVTGAAYEAAARSTRFEEFLTQVLPDEGMRCFLARVFGHALPGRVTEHLLPILTGTGSNGKSTLLGAVMGALGDYAIAAEPDLLIEKASAHPTGQADLLGVRLAVCAETEQGRRLAAATVKRLTGGDRVRARRMRQDYIEWEPSHSIILVTNHKPLVPSEDSALWRRLRLIPFDVVITKPDRTLGEQLLLELPAVLAWIVRGHTDWQVNGIGEPQAVLNATEEYRSSSDAVARFLDDRITYSTMAAVASRDLFGAWSGWCRANGEQASTERAFSEGLGHRGIKKVKRHGVMTWLGLMLASEDGE